MKEGTWFAVPLSDGTYAAGVVARVARRGVLLAYFFAPRLAAPPEIDAVLSLTTSQAHRAFRVGDLGLQDGSWPILGVDPNWRRDDWPVPLFVRRPPLSEGLAFAVKYSDADIAIEESSQRVSPNVQLESAGLAGAGAAEMKLSESLPSND